LETRLGLRKVAVTQVAVNIAGFCVLGSEKASFSRPSALSEGLDE